RRLVSPSRPSLRIDYHHGRVRHPRRACFTVVDAGLTESAPGGRGSGCVAKKQEPWKPFLDPGVDLRGLPLTPEEGFVASRLDGATDSRSLAAVTGLPPERIEAALEKLASLGAVVRPEAPDEDEPDEHDETAAGIHRKLYETTLRQLESGERAARAKLAVDPELSAFCFDPLPEVLHGLLENA